MVSREQRNLGHSEDSRGAGQMGRLNGSWASESWARGGEPRRGEAGPGSGTHVPPVLHEVRRSLALRTARLTSQRPVLGVGSEQ